MAAAHNKSLAEMVGDIDASPRAGSLTSALRVAVLNWVREA
jgi:predicted DNA-binding ribbon-helix-helix protein